MKVSNDQLAFFVDQGLTVTEIARKLEMSKGAISKRLSKLNLAVAKSSAGRAADAIVDHKINSIEQLEKVNLAANELLDCLMRWHRGDPEALQILESQVRKVKVKGQESEVTEFKMQDPRKLALQAMNEIRGQLSLQLDIYKTLWDMKAAQEFEAEVLATIAEVDPNVRDQILHRLEKKRTIRIALRPTD